ncbi:MAG: hypothetical protein ABJH68_10105 [Ilumatobacter sp.]|uniref:hypothetical protein n=1 Tax=Ilumatobacter sp. TaxID=1967498 RepID=UPI003296A96E
MRCHVCNVAVGDGQRFCHECGESLDGVTDATQAHDVITADGVEVDPDDVTLETRSDREPALESETVAPPSQPEPHVVPAHRGALPDLARPPLDDDAAHDVDDDDAAWWAAGGGAPEPTDEVDDTLPKTEAMELAPASHSELHAVPEETIPHGPLADPPAFEPTTTMPTTGERSTWSDVTDEYPPGNVRGVGSTAEMAVTRPGGLFDGGVDEHDLPPASGGFRLRASFVFGFLAMVATLMASVADVTDIRTTRPVDGIIVGIRTLDDFGTNLAVAGFVGAALMLVGGLLSCFGLRWGAGLAGGAGLSMTGWAAVTLGLVEAPIHAAEGVTANANEVTAFTLSVTRDLGYFLILAIGVLGLVVFIVSLRMAGTGGRGGLNPWIAAVGALAAVVLAAGPLITLGGAPLDANLGTIGVPKEFFAGRLVQLALIVVTGVVGFLSVRTYGLGLAAGGLGVATWMWITSLAEVGDLPVSIAVGNVGTLETTPHAVTTVGVTASLALLLIAATVATVTRRRV